jgi:hypothetical protein
MNEITEKMGQALVVDWGISTAAAEKYKHFYWTATKGVVEGLELAVRYDLVPLDIDAKMEVLSDLNMLWGVANRRGQ